VEDQMREGHAAQADAEVGHMREVGLRRPPRRVDLREDDRALGAVLRPPGRDVALQGAQLDRRVAPGVALAQQREEGRRLQRRVARQLRLDPRPLVLEGIRAGAMGPRLLQLAG
jgi:hypothetical protein